MITRNMSDFNNLVTGSFRIDLLTIEYLYCETFRHFSHQNSLLITCYFHQDLHHRLFHQGLHLIGFKTFYPKLPPRSKKNRRVYLLVKTSKINFNGWGSVFSFSVIHFQGSFIRLVSCYTFLSECRLPWPSPSCQNESTLFVVSRLTKISTLYLNFRSIPHHRVCLPNKVH